MSCARLPQNGPCSCHLRRYWLLTQLLVLQVLLLTLLLLLVLVVAHRDMVTITVRTDLSRIQRTNLETCITVHMHQKESTQDLVNKKVGVLVPPLTTPSVSSVSCRFHSIAPQPLGPPCSSAELAP
jgi:hypothetical protein